MAMVKMRLCSLCIMQVKKKECKLKSAVQIDFSNVTFHCVCLILPDVFYDVYSNVVLHSD